MITEPAERSFSKCLCHFNASVLIILSENQLKGSITNAGPFDAEIRFNDGLTISWSGKPLGKIAMPPVQVNTQPINSAVHDAETLNHRLLATSARPWISRPTLRLQMLVI